MENVNAATVITGVTSRFHTDELNSCFDEFLRLKPDFDVMGEVFFVLLKDATTSLIKSIAKTSNNAIISDNSEKISELADTYARVYFTVNKDEASLLMLRSALYDLIRGYDYNDKKQAALASNLYESIKKLITV